MKAFLAKKWRRWKRPLVLWSAIAFGLFAVVTTRVVCSSRSEYSLGRAAEKKALQQSGAAQARGLDDAVVHYRRAARWYAPFNPYVSRSLAALWRLGTAAEARGDLPAALKAFRAIRRAILGARSFYTPHADRLGPANARIAKLSALLEAQGVGRPPGHARPSAAQIAQFERWHRAQLGKDHAPSVFWSILALLGFGTWIAGAFLFIYRAITVEDRLLGRPALIWGGVVAGGLLLWVLGLSQA